MKLNFFKLRYRKVSDFKLSRCDLQKQTLRLTDNRPCHEWLIQITRKTDCHD